MALTSLAPNLTLGHIISVAESILTQITFANGAVNIAYNTVLYSNFASGNQHPYYSTINSYDWKCAVVYHPMAANPFICFSTYSIFNSATMTNIDGTSFTGATIHMLSGSSINQFMLYSGNTLFLFA